MAPPEGSFLATGRGKVTLALLCAVTFLDVMDGAIVNVALPTIRTHLGFSVQNLQWVVSGYLITCGCGQARRGRSGRGSAAVMVQVPVRRVAIVRLWTTGGVSALRSASCRAACIPCGRR
jgi:MFS family permease